MRESALIYQVEANVARLTLNRPEALNSFNTGLLDEMLVALRDIHKQKSIRVVRLSAIGRGFCAGQDLKQRFADLQHGAVDLGAALEKGVNRLVTAIHAMPQPVVCAVNGYASGAGIGLALASDIVIAADSARFDLAFSRLGLVPDAGVSLFLAQRVGVARARALVLLGESLDAPTAADWGLIWRSVADEQLDTETDRIVQRLLDLPAGGLGLSKTLLARPAEPLVDRLKHEAEMQRMAGRSPDYREAVEAFVSKRRPRFGT